VTEQFDVFLSYNRRDRRAVEPLAEALRERKLKVFKDDWYLRPDVPALHVRQTARAATDRGLRPL
jgi:hypothetical protein